MIAQALSCWTAGHLRTKTIHEHMDSSLDLYSLSPSAKELRLVTVRPVCLQAS